jgi:hypothetical protein
LITAALQAYADRGVFRGFRATPAARGRVNYRFVWLTRQPMTAVFDPRRGVLSFPSLFPHVDSTVAALLTAAVDPRAQKGQPEHRRVDARRARIAGAVRKGAFSLTVEIRGRNHAYAVKKVLNLINELFVGLHEHHPAYLVERFGLSSE